MHLCLDIDDTITYAPEFFSRLVGVFQPSSVSIISFRTDRDEAEELLNSIPIRFDTLILSSDEKLGRSADEPLANWKADQVNRLKPDIFFEDMPEVVALIDPGIVVFMPCDEVIRAWLREKID